MIEMRIMELEALSQDPLQSSDDLAQNAQEKLDLEIKLPLIRSQEFFLLDNNGSLRTAGQFDFEQNTTSYWVRVIATDEDNASVEKDFEIHLLNDSADDPSEIISSSIRAKVNGQLVVGIVVEDSLDRHSRIRAVLGSIWSYQCNEQSTAYIIRSNNWNCDGYQ